MGMRESDAADAVVMNPLLGCVAGGATGSGGGAGSATTSAAGAVLCIRAAARDAGGSMGVKVVGEGAGDGDGAVEATTRCARRTDVARPAVLV
jgi:hypothetical protein